MQETFEKVGFQRFVRQQTLQLHDLKPEYSLFAILRCARAIVDRVITCVNSVWLTHTIQSNKGRTRVMERQAGPGLRLPFP